MSEIAHIGRVVAKPRLWLTSVLLLVVATLATPAQAQTHSGQQFTMVIRGEGATGVAVGRGAITGVGSFRETEEDVGLFTFPSGTLRVRGFFTEEASSFDPRSCVGTFETSGTWIVEEGTGDYKGATGSGRLEGRVKFGTDRTPDGCGESERFAVAVFRLSGDVSLPT